MKTYHRIYVATLWTGMAFLVAGCDKSRLNPDEPVSSATIAIMFDGSPERAIPNAAAKEILPSLSKAAHEYHSGSPNPRLKYRLRIRQNGITEDFYFLDDFDLVSCKLPESDRAKVAAWMKETTEGQSAMAR